MIPWRFFTTKNLWNATKNLPDVVKNLRDATENLPDAAKHPSCAAENLWNVPKNLRDAVENLWDAPPDLRRRPRAASWSAPVLWRFVRRAHGGAFQKRWRTTALQDAAAPIRVSAPNGGRATKGTRLPRSGCTAINKAKPRPTAEA